MRMPREDQSTVGSRMVIDAIWTRGIGNVLKNLEIIESSIPSLSAIYSIKKQ